MSRPSWSCASRPESIPDRKRGLLCQNRRAGIALFLGGIKIAVIAVQLKDGLLRLELCLLQADHIGIFLRAVVKKALAETGPQAVDIPGYQFHRYLQVKKIFPWAGRVRVHKDFADL